MKQKENLKSDRLLFS